MYAHSLLIEEDICDCQNVSVTFLCVCVFLLSGDSSFFDKNFLFLFLILCYPYFGTFPFHKVSEILQALDSEISLLSGFSSEKEGEENSAEVTTTCREIDSIQIGILMQFGVMIFILIQFLKML